MKEYSLDFHLAQVLLLKEVREWFLSTGPQIAKKNGIPKELFIHITSLMHGFSSLDVEKVFEAVNKKLFIDVTKGNLNKFTIGFFSVEKYVEESRQTAERYQARMAF